MTDPSLHIIYVGGPTALIEFGGARLLTDPTFDPAGSAYPSGSAVLHKVAGPKVAVEEIGRVDAVLLSHDHHADNLDHAGRGMLASAEMVLTTTEGAERLDGNAVALRPWESVGLLTPQGRTVRITATPARHGPAHMDRGPVIGFVVEFKDAPGEGLYVSGDTVWYDGVEEVARRFRVKTAVLFLGAARVAAVGPWHLTMTAEEAVLAARAFDGARIVPLHYEGWEHFSQARGDIERAFAGAGLADRLWWV